MKSSQKDGSGACVGVLKILTPSCDGILIIRRQHFKIF